MNGRFRFGLASNPRLIARSLGLVRRRSADDVGLITAELAFGMVVGLFPVIVFMYSFAQWPGRQAVAVLAASEGARAAALADDATGARQAMDRQVQASIAASGLTDGNVSARIDGVFDRGEHIEVTVAIDMPTIVIPGLAPFTTRRYQTTAVERVDVHRLETVGTE